MSVLAILVVSATSLPLWQWENPVPHGGSIAAIHGDGPSLWAVGARGAMFSSSDGGTTWVAFEAGAVEDLHAIDGVGSLTVAVGDRGIVLRSRDGATFDKKSLGTSVSLVGVTVAATTVFTVASDGSLWRSSDGGDSFTALPQLQLGMPTSIAIAPSGVYVGTTEGLYRSTDAGATFAQVLGEPVQRIAVTGSSIHAISGATVVYPSLQICGSCMDASYDVTALYRTRDGKTWERRTLEDPTTTQRSWGPPIAHSPPKSPPKGASHGYRGVGAPRIRSAWTERRALELGPAGEIYAQANQLYVSTDGATFATKKSRGTALWAGAKRLVVAGIDGFAWSGDRGTSWHDVTRASGVLVGEMTAMPDGRILGIASEGVLLARDKTAWTKVALPITKHQRASSIFALDENHVILVGDQGLLLQSTDGGRKFVHRATDSTQDLVSVWGSGGEVFISGRESLLHSKDRGASWESVRGKGYQMGTLWGTSATDLWLVGSYVHHSTDRGRTWRKVEPELYGFTAAWGSGNDVVIVGRGGKILSSSDHGKTWKARSSGTTKDLYDVWGRGDEMFAVGSESYDRGPVVLHSRDRGATWTEEVIHADIPLRSITGTKDAVFVTGVGSILRRTL